MDRVRHQAAKRELDCFAAQVWDPLLRTGFLMTGAARDAEDLVQPPGQQGHPEGSPARIGLADGIVSDAGASGFTVTTPAGFHVRVTTPADTAVYQLHRTSLPALKTGAFTAAAAGRAGPDGTLRATAADQGANLPHVGTGRPSNPHLPGPAAPGCSSLTVATALLTAG